MRRPDPTRKGEFCGDETRAELGRGADKGACTIEGSWARDTDVWGEPGEVSLTVGKGGCTMKSPTYTGSGKCTLQENTLIWTNGKPTGKAARVKGCQAGRKVRYTVTFAYGCGGLVLEAQNDPCQPRALAVEYLFLEK